MVAGVNITATSGNSSLSIARCTLEKRNAAIRVQSPFRTTTQKIARAIHQGVLVLTNWPTTIKEIAVARRTSENATDPSIRSGSTMPPNVGIDPSTLSSLYWDHDSKHDDDEDLEQHPHEQQPAGGGLSKGNKTASSWDNLVDIEDQTTKHQSARSIATNVKPTKDPPRSSSSTQQAATSRSSRHSDIRSYLREKSSRGGGDDGQWNEESRIDTERLNSAVRNAGLYSCGGVVGVEVWMLSEEQGREGWLTRPRGGWWSSSTLVLTPSPSALRDDGDESDETLIETVPGVGLAGALWAESRGAGRMQKTVQSKEGLHRNNGSKVSLSSLASMQDYMDSWAVSYPIQWRDMEAMFADPDTAKDERFTKYMESGFGLAAAVPFYSWGYKGIVLFLAKPGVSIEELSIIENEVYMVTSSQIIGSTLASIDARRACSLVRRHLKEEGTAAARIHKEEEEEEASETQIEHSESQEEIKPFHVRHCRDSSVRQFQIWLRKSRGGSAQIPPRMPFREGLYTLLGVFCGLLVVSTMNELTMDLSNDQYFLLIAPFGALATLQYGLTAAPGSQPRNAILGQVVAGAISIAFTYIPEEILATWLRRAVGPAFAITAMVVLGIPHPPAGAHSVIYASGQYNWAFYSLVILASVISIIPATLVNNLSSKRQYPTFWGYGPEFLLEQIRRRKTPTKEVEPT